MSGLCDRPAYDDPGLPDFLKPSPEKEAEALGAIKAMTDRAHAAAEDHERKIIAEMTTFTLEEVRYLLDLIREKHGKGYAKDDMVAQLQAKLSIWGQVAVDRERGRTG